MRTRIKFCGCTSPADALLAVETGADAVGLIFAQSPRRVSEDGARRIARELPPFVTAVGVFVNPTYEELQRAKSVIPDLVLQLHGDETPDFASSLEGRVIKAIGVEPAQLESGRLQREAHRYPNALLLFDTKIAGSTGGTGVTFAWETVAGIARERAVMVSGGLTPENVSACVRAVRPYAVDVRSGIESENRKDVRKMRAFVRAVKEADAA